ncbi:ParB/RepB/Spo0J family partition protein [Fluviispira vulneris]|uniref:ParB/RepB/Spo0J family partition protein n=1 Tax=Fluviispira vulneris TaxID=2763012 RepID=UPI001647F676|nr:ParB/RepB/Spo0J family partition protein [Fluviispira vulneris]
MSTISQAIEAEKLSRFASVVSNSDRLNTVLLYEKAAEENKTVALNVNQIKLNENIRNRIDISKPEFLDLKNSIASEGVIQPVLVEVRRNIDGDDFELIAVAGHRRILACKELGIEKIKANLKVYSSNSSKRTEHALIENLLREDLHPIDVAEGYADLVAQGWDADDIAKKFSRDKKYIKNIIKVGQWPIKARELIKEFPEKFSLRSLCNISKKKWDSEEKLLDELKFICGLVKGERVPPRQKITSEKFSKYISENKISDYEKNLIENALKFFGFKF